MSFNLVKCEVMRITHQRDISVPKYHFSGKLLKAVNHFKDLGIIISNNLKWNEQVNSTVNKANSFLCLIKRILSALQMQLFLQSYISYIPILEYATPVWSPYLVKDVIALEGI